MGRTRGGRYKGEKQLSPWEEIIAGGGGWDQEKKMQGARHDSRRIRYMRLSSSCRRVVKRRGVTEQEGCDVGAKSKRKSSQLLWKKAAG